VQDTYHFTSEFSSLLALNLDWIPKEQVINTAKVRAVRKGRGKDWQVEVKTCFDSSYAQSETDLSAVLERLVKPNFCKSRL